MWFSETAVRGRSDCGVRGVARLGVTPPNHIADVIQLVRTDILLSILYCCASKSAAAWVAANTFEAN
jgi:hypothetical protein